MVVYRGLSWFIMVYHVGIHYLGPRNAKKNIRGPFAKMIPNLATFATCFSIACKTK